jgi:hypothetical protein
MQQVKSFNLFRVNCLLNDSKASNFNAILLSIVSEFFFEIKNEYKNLKEVYRYITEYLKINIEFDFFESLIVKSGFFDIEVTDNIPLLKMKPDKFKDVEKAIYTFSVENYIESFLKEKGLEISLKESIEKLLYAAVFENINSFSVTNLKTLLPDIDEENFTRQEIDIFNEFLDYEDAKKNRAIFNVLSKAVEFAILTSGKGIDEIKIEVFRDKTFMLDTNILFRLLGIGGEERAESTKTLLLKCRELGINFKYTSKTHFELNNKLDQIITFLNTAKVQANIDLLGSLSEVSPELFNEDFIVHYSILRSKQIVKTPEQYQRNLYNSFHALLKSLDMSIYRDEKVDEKEVNRFAKVLFSRKREMGIRYGRKASEVDSYNVFIVKKIRGYNNYNFSDVKSFYLTSDRSLNVIISQENKSTIPETILPSQLYILCKPYFNEELDGDYDEFIKFIKRRKTSFAYAGSQVLTYINSIRELTTDAQIVSQSLILYSNIRYKTAAQKDFEIDAKIPNYKTVLRTLLDKQLAEGAEATRIVGALKAETDKFAFNQFKKSKGWAMVSDALATILVIPLALVIAKAFTDKIMYQIIVVLICEILKFYISSRFKVFNQFHLRLYRKFTSKRRASVLALGEELVEIIDAYEEKTQKSIWEK